MIYSKFGSALTLVSKYQRNHGHLSIQATAGDTRDLREYGLGDMKADGGLAEIEQAIAKLPWKEIVGRRALRG